jgi:DNA-binding LacI/PurR family transcriptional regulator
MFYPLDVDGLAAVTIGTSLHHPPVHRIAANLYQGSQLACRKLREKGFRRIGLVLSSTMIERVEGKWFGAYLAEQAFWPASERLPPLVVDTDGRDAFRNWLRRAKPDVILMAEPEVEQWLGREANPPPTVWLRMTAATPKGALAVDTRPEMMGAAAVELVVGQIHRNERGSPALPNTLLLDPVWRG